MADLFGMLQASAGAVSGAESDDDFANTVLLLHGDGTNGAQNNTFIDSSTNNFTITRNGNTTQGSFSPFSKPDGRWGNYFSTTDASRLSATVSAIGSGDFTLEFWLNAPTTPSDNVRVVRYGAFNTSGNFQVLLLTSGVIRIDGNASTSLITGSVDLRFSGFHHVAITRSGTDLKLFIDGTQDGSTATFSANLTATALEIGGDSSLGALYDFDGWLSNVRTVTGTALYTSAFTPSTTPLTAISGTSLLTCQSNRFKDNSTNNFAITRNGDVKVTPFSPFPLTTEYTPSVNGGSGYFDGSGDDIRAGAVNLGFNDFTVECWFYPTTVSGTLLPVYALLNGSKADVFAIQIQNGVVYIYASDGSPWNVINGSNAGTIKANEWTHVAVTRSGSNFYAYVNGVRGFTVSSASTIGNLNGFSIGSPAISGYDYPGYISDFRQVVGTALYTGATFTPPTAPLTAIANTSLLCNFTNAGIFDNTCFNNLETVANAQVDTNVVKFGTGSMKFDGTGDYLVMKDIPEMAFGTGDFTIEMFIYLTNVTNLYYLFDWRPNGSEPNGPWSYINAGVPRLGIGGSSIAISSSAISINTWTHLAFVRNSGTIKIYLDGVEKASQANTTSLVVGANRPVIGAQGSSTGGFAIPAYLDEFRVSKIARYTTAFTPPDKAFPNVGA